MPNRISMKFKRMSELYQHFAKDYPNLDFSETARLELFMQESFGNDYLLSENNGFAVGKQRLNLSVQMWKEDIPRGILHISELYNDPNYPKNWLDSVFKYEFVGYRKSQYLT